MNEIKCVVVTPEQTVCEESADFVALTLFDGEIGIGRAHTPLIGRLGAGEMRIVRDDETIRYYVEGGFVETVDDVVSVLTQRAIPVSELDAAAAEEQLAAAGALPADTPERMAARDRAVTQARAQLRIAQHAQ